MTRSSGLGFVQRTLRHLFRPFGGHRPTRLLVLGILGLLSACAEQSAPDEQLREWIAAAELAAEEKNRGDLLELISPNYADSRGYGRDDINNMLRIYFLRQQRIALLTRIVDVEITGGSSARVEVTVGMAGTNDRLLGISADAYRFELELEAAGQSGTYKDWQLLSARWGALGEAVR